MTAEPPPVSELQPTAPPLLDHLIRRCLAKEPDERWQSALDACPRARVDRGVGSGEACLVRSPVRRPRTDYRIEYFKSSRMGASIAAARGGSGRPLFVVPTHGGYDRDVVATLLPQAFADHELITYDRRGTGLSERGSIPAEPEPYHAGRPGGQSTVSGWETSTSLARCWGRPRRHGSRRSNPQPGQDTSYCAHQLIGLGDWASIPGVRAALAAMEQDWEYFTESFAQFVVGLGQSTHALQAGCKRLRAITSREELRALFSEAFMKLDLIRGAVRRRFRLSRWSSIILDTSSRTPTRAELHP